MMPSETAPSPQEIRPRRVSFTWSTTPLAWIPGEVQTAHTIDVLHLLFPAGERWFVRVFQEAVPFLAGDESLLRAVRGFMGQEATHARAHALVQEHLAAQGIDVDRYLRRVDWLFERALAPEPFGRHLSPDLARSWLLARVAIIAALEHYFAFLGSWVLEAKALDDAGADPRMLALIRWHAAEEVEHRTVAFDAAVALGVGPVERGLAMLLVSAVATSFWLEGGRFLMRRSPAVTKPGSFADLRRAGRLGLLPTLESLALQIPRYMRPGYHPSETGSIEHALAYLRTAPLGEPA